MSGIRVYNFREGDRSEYLANYLLSGIGLVNPVARQEDIGLDFYCTLANEETGNLSFNNQFVIQIKSDKEDIVYGKKSGKDNWKKHEIDWFLNLEIPCFIGILDKMNCKLEIFNVSPIWFIHRENKDCSMITLRHRKTSDAKDVGRPIEEKINNWGNGNGNNYIIDLGNPIITLDNSSFENKDLLKDAKQKFRNIIKLERENIVLRDRNLPYFKWVLREENNQFIYGWIHYDEEKEIQSSEELVNTLSNSLISLAISLSLNNKQDELEGLKKIIHMIPDDKIYHELKTKYENIFKKNAAPNNG